MLPSIRDEIENPNRDDAINQLETLARRGYFSIPIYEFKEIYDNNGNPIWNCECRIAEEDYYFDGTSSSKKEAKKDSAFRMLFYYESGEYEYIEKDGFSIDRGEYVYNWDDSEYRREEEECRNSLFDDEDDD